MTREVRIMCGVPGVGKSTWIDKETRALREEGWYPVHISRDDIRFRFLDDNNSEDYFAFEDDVMREFIREINECAEEGFDYIFVDATHISPASRIKLLRQLRLDARTDVVFEVFDFPLEVALYRNGQRQGRERVPVSAVKSMWKNFKTPNEVEIHQIKEQLGWKNNFIIRSHSKEE